MGKYGIFIIILQGANPIHFSISGKNFFHPAQYGPKIIYDMGGKKRFYRTILTDSILRFTLKVLIVLMDINVELSSFEVPYYYMNFM